MKSLLSIDTNAKTVKGQKKGYLTGILYLAPANLSGKNLCPHASAGCRAACLNTAGRGQFDQIQSARLSKTLLFIKNRASFLAQLEKDIRALVKKAERKGLTPCVRLNGTSDIPWHSLGIMDAFPAVQFYDYTPNHSRMVDFLNGKLPSNYSLTFSRKEDNDALVKDVMSRGGNVAVVFKDIPQEWNGKSCFDGDQSDLRFLDPKGVVVALTAKGKAKKDSSGFVI